ncbi:MAG: cardiolipin synthase [Clostridia bacterium]|nr:cardiolipin synthase [Clostridia bacterium]
MRRTKTLIFASRFFIVFLSIIAQAIALWILFFILGRKYQWVQFVSSAVGVMLFLYIVNKDQPAVYKLPWVIIILFAPLVGIVTYYTFGNVKLSKKQMKKFRHIYDEHHDEYYSQAEILKRMLNLRVKGLGTVRYIRSATSLPVYSNSKVSYINNGEMFFESLCEQISKAEKYVFLEYFIVEKGKMLYGVIKALEEVMQRGVKVYFMYDDVGSITKVRRRFNKELCSLGIDARRFFKFVPIVSVIHNNRDHRKIAVIDGKVGFMSGANLADEYINEKKPLGKWRDNALKIEGQATDTLVRLFIQLFNMTGGKQLDEIDFIHTDHEQFSDGYILPFGDSPYPINSEHVAETVYLDMISRAEKYLYITTPYLIVDTNITDALKTAVKRGVDVRIIIPQNPDKKIVYLLTKSACKNLCAAGVKIYAFKDGFIHSKTVLSDGEMAVVGTSNFDFRSLVHHFECATLICENSSINDIYSDFLHLFDYECVKYTAKDLKLNAFQRLIKSIAILFAPLM